MTANYGVRDLVLSFLLESANFCCEKALPRMTVTVFVSGLNGLGAGGGVTMGC